MEKEEVSETESIVEITLLGQALYSRDISCFSCESDTTKQIETTPTTASEPEELCDSVFWWDGQHFFN